LNAQDIYVGGDYAYFPNRGRGESYRPSDRNVHRVKAMRVFKRKNSHYAERLSTFVEVLFLNKEGIARMNGGGAEMVREIAARDIVSEWEEYWNEDQVRQEERLKHEEERRKQEEQRKAEDEFILNRAAMRGMKREAIRINKYNDNVTISRQEMKRWLNIP
jgi:hypothetical protein